jgi:cytochrome c
VPGDFVLSQDNMAQVQQRLPNRNGLTTAHGLWEVRGKPDVRNTACMKDCPVQFAGVGGMGGTGGTPGGTTAVTAGVASALPESYRGSHGNLAEQNRLIGPVRGSVQGVGAMAAATNGAAASATTSATTTATTPTAAQTLATRHACLSCHAPQGKLLGPSIQDIAGKYRGEAGAEAKLLAKLKAGGAGVWGAIPMPAQSHVKEDELRSILQWMLGGG